MVCGTASTREDPGASWLSLVEVNEEDEVREEAGLSERGLELWQKYIYQCLCMHSDR